MTQIPSGVVKFLQHLQESSKKRIYQGCIDRKNYGITLHITEKEPGIVECGENGIYFHTQQIKLEKGQSRKNSYSPPTAYDLIACAILSRKYIECYKCVLTDLDGYYYYTPLSKNVLAHYLGVDSLSDDELAKLAERYAEDGIEELDDKLQAALDNELDIDPSQAQDASALTTAYAKLNFKIEYVEFTQDKTSGASSSTKQASDRVHITIP
jgi:hypothetical protein